MIATTKGPEGTIVCNAPSSPSEEQLVLLASHQCSDLLHRAQLIKGHMYLGLL